jgi:hypothetical protein
MNEKKRLRFCLVMVAGCAVLFGGCEMITAFVDGGEGIRDSGGRSVALYESAYYVDPAGDDEENDGKSEYEPFATLEAAYNAAKTSSTRRRIVVLDNLAKAGPIVLDGTGDVSSDPVLIEGVDSGVKIERTGGQNGSVLEITNYAKIKFENIEVNGIKDNFVYNRAIKVVGPLNNDTDLLQLQADYMNMDTTVVTLGNGAVLTGKVVYTDDPTEMMRRGGGIQVDQGAKLVMLEGSTVTGCSSLRGAVYVYNSVFVMENGEISDNTATLYGGGVDIEKSAQFIMLDGTISGNTVTGTSKWNMGYGGGVYAAFADAPGGTAGVSPTFIMKGGTISKNTAKEAGGGIFLAATNFTLDGGNIIDNRVTANDLSGGGGIAAEGGGYDPLVSSTFTMNGGVVSGNKVESGGGGGGIGIWECEFTMNGGEISGNSSVGGEKAAAGGVYLYDDAAAVFTMTGGVIYGSDATGNDPDGNPLANTASSTSAKGDALYKGQQAVITGSGIPDGETESLDADGSSAKAIDGTIDMRS